MEESEIIAISALLKLKYILKNKKNNKKRRLKGRCFYHKFKHQKCPENCLNRKNLK